MPLYRFSSRSFPNRPDLISEIPYVMRLEFDGLKQEVRSIVGRPIACFKCNGFLTDINQIHEDEKTGKYFICSFCGTLNVVEDQTIVAGDDVDILIEPPPSSGTPDSTQLSPDIASFLAVLDLSGSMSGASLSAVKRSLSSSIDSIAANSPDTIFGLITFDSDVIYYNLDGSNRFELPKDMFHRLDSIVEFVENIVDDIKLISVGKNKGIIQQHIHSLNSGGITALGPAMAFAYGLAMHYRVSRVVLLTDGLANSGIGSFEGVQYIPPKTFYSDLARRFFDIGTIVDVVGLATSSGIEMKTLGIMPDLTNGQVYYVTPNELDASIAELAGAEFLGRDVEVRIITPPGVTIRDVSGMSKIATEHLKKSHTAKIGTVGTDHEVCISLAPNSMITSNEIPIQLQVEYVDSTGARRIRVVTSRLRVTGDESELVAHMDPTVAATFVTQKAGEAAFDGSAEDGRRLLSSFRTAMKKRAKSAPIEIQQAIELVDTALVTEEGELIEMEETLSATPSAMQSAAADIVYTQSLRQKRRSSKTMFKKSLSDDEDAA